MDESAIDKRDALRKYGRGPRGSRLYLPTRLTRGKRYTLLPALCSTGFFTYEIVEGGCDMDLFMDFMILNVIPKMNSYPEENSILVLDNCAIDDDQRLVQAAEEHGILIKYLPTHSPDFTPIEGSFHVLKDLLKRLAKDFPDTGDVKGLLRLAIEIGITPQTVQYCYRDCGYLSWHEL